MSDTPADRETGRDSSREGSFDARLTSYVPATDPEMRPGLPTERPDSPAGPADLSSLDGYIETPGLFEENRLPTHVTATVPYESPGAALAADEPFTPLVDRFAESPYVSVLDGEWAFQFYERPADMPDSLDDAEWGSIPVPSVWQRQGYGQTIYSNNSITWDEYEPPLDGDLDPRDGDIEVPETNPTGVYRREFSVPEGWGDREVLLHFDGVDQAYFVWVDGEYVGFQQGSKTPGEFDVTDLVEPGGNHEVTVRVHRFSDAEALETIDMFRYSGIFRSVYLVSKPPVHVRDFFVRTGLDDDYEDGFVRVDAEVTADPAGGATDEDVDGYTLRGHLLEPDSDPEAADDPAEAAVATLTDDVTADEGTGTAALSTDLDDPDLWSAEKPNLYALVLELVDPEGEAVEAMLEKVGVCEYETTRGKPGAQVLVNGEPTNVRGTNRHEADPATGRTMRHGTMVADFERLKGYNLNAVRTSHYPNDPTFNRLADEYGIYVQDEVNAETHWWEDLAASTTAFHEQFLARFRRMVLRDRNHPSVFSWSTGNEAGTGAEHIEMASLVSATDEHLPDGVNGESFDGSALGVDDQRIRYHQPNGGGWIIDYSDMLGPRYSGVNSLPDEGDGTGLGDGLRPVVMGEYNHAMGNSLGIVDGMWRGHIQPPVRRAADLSDAGNDGVLLGSPEMVSGSGERGAVVLDGEGDSVEIPGLDGFAAGSAEFTVGVSIGDLDAGGGAPLVSGPGFELGATDSEFAFAVEGDDERAEVIAPRSTEEGWTRIDAVCEPGALRLFLDGTEVGRVDHDVSELDGRGPVRIGRDSDGTAHAAVTVDAVTVVDAARDVESPAPDDSDDVVAEYDFAALLRDQALMGGFIWDWVNQDVDATTVVDGEEIRYQDYDDDPFCLNGLVWSDRTPTPALSQLKYNHQPVGFAAADATAGDLYVTNHHGFTDLDEYDVAWELTRDGEVIQSGTLDFDVPPGETRRVRVPFHDPMDPEPDAEYHLSLSVATTDDAPYAEAGHEVAREQIKVPFDLSDAPATGDDANSLPPVSVTEDGDAVTVEGENFEYVFDAEAGTLSDLTYGGTTVIERGPLFNAWRVPIMNESQNWGGEQASSWYEAGLDDLTQTVDSVDVTAEESVATVEVEGSVRGADLGNLMRTTDAAGTYATAHGDPEVVDGVSGRAVSFTGESHLTVERSDPPTLDSGLTLECWVDPGESGAGDPQPYVIAGGQYLLKRRSADRGGELEFAVYSDAWRTVAADVPDDWTDGWHHVAGVWDGDADELRIYVDGEHRDTTDFGNELGEFDGRIRVGRDRESFVADGTAVDEVRVYDRGLDPAAVGDLDAPGDAFTHLPLDGFETVDRSTPAFETRYRYRVYGDGELTVEVEVDPNQSLVDTVDDYLPKAGVRTELPREFDEFEWFGRGPTETYPDRKTGTPVGRYEGGIGEQYVPYIPPTDNGNRTDTRWAALSNGEVGLLGAPLGGTINVNLEQWANLDDADHEHELEPRETVAFDLDHAVSGVGGTPVSLNETFQVKPEPASFGVRLRPFAGADPMDLARSGPPDDRGE